MDVSQTEPRHFFRISYIFWYRGIPFYHSLTFQIKKGKMKKFKSWPTVHLIIGVQISVSKEPAFHKLEKERLRKSLQSPCICHSPFLGWPVFPKSTKEGRQLELRQYKNDSIQSKKIPILKLPLFSSPIRQRKKSGNFKTGTFLDWMQSFLYCLSSNTHIV